jgi:DNA-directed RNA polymerase subunit M/transcription elongation factor TFIIS
MVRISCPECGLRLYEYREGDWTEYVCWKCGHYESNSPAFKSAPYLFVNLVRDNPIHFMKKYSKYSSSPTQNQHDFKHQDDSTEPNIVISGQTVSNSR